VFHSKSDLKKAFTLTELLVSMAVLGLIATLTLPHMFISADRAKKRAVFKEAYQALQEAVHTAAMEGVADSRGIIPYLNAQKVCLTNSLTEGCTTSTMQSGDAGVVLHNGVSIVGFNTGANASTPIRSDDTVAIGLEDFAKKEYFRINTSLMDQTNEDRYVGQNDGTVQTVIDVRPGEIKCLEQACFDMFKTD
jgi:prepilin-type N-terminal cleavage/methylation domain-containing protein